MDPNVKRKYMRNIIEAVKQGRAAEFSDLFAKDTKKLRRNKSLPDIPNVEKAPD